MAASGPGGLRGKQGSSVDRGLCLLLTTAWRKHRLDVPGWQRVREWPHRSALWHRHSCLPPEGMQACPFCRECWPLKHDIVPRQPMNELQAHITQHLDKVATQNPSNITWDIFAWSDTNKNCWKEDFLPYSPGSTGRPQLKNAGDLVSVTWWGRKVSGGGMQVLRFEGLMLVYDPQTNGMGWVMMKGVPSSLTKVESRSLQVTWETSIPAHPWYQQAQRPPNYSQGSQQWSMNRRRPDCRIPHR